MALFDVLFRDRPKPGWMTRGQGRIFVDLCLLAFDGVIEGLYQARLNLLGVDPHPSAVPHIAGDAGIPNGVFETVRQYVVRMRRKNWSWRAAGLAGIADVQLDTQDWSGDVPTVFSGRPTEEGCWLLIDIGGTAGTPGISYQVSTDGGLSYGGATALGTELSITLGDLVVTWRTGDSLPIGTLRFNHGGRGLLLNDFGAPVRGNVAAASPAGDESLLHEIAQQVGPCRIRLVSQRDIAEDTPVVGTWWTREVDGTTWRYNDGPWAWERLKDIAGTHRKRGVIIIDNPPNILPWEVLGANTHYLGEPQASFGTTATTEWWNRLYVTISQFKPAEMLVVAVIINFDNTKFNPNDPENCMQGDWYLPHKYDSNGNVTLTRPINYAWFSGPM